MFHVGTGLQREESQPSPHRDRQDLRMASDSASAPVIGPQQDYGIRFTTSEWNDSIVNGEPFLIAWNRTANLSDVSFYVARTAFDNGLAIPRETIEDLTSTMDEKHGVWIPHQLDDDDLYLVHLSTHVDGERRWASSPIWAPAKFVSSLTSKLTETSSAQTLHTTTSADPVSSPRSDGQQWAAPIGVPLAVVLSIYLACIITAFVYRRRKAARGGGRDERILMAAAPGDAAGGAARFARLSTATIPGEPAARTYSETTTTTADSVRKKSSASANSSLRDMTAPTVRRVPSETHHRRGERRT